MSYQEVINIISNMSDRALLYILVHQFGASHDDMELMSTTDLVDILAMRIMYCPPHPPSPKNVADPFYKFRDEVTEL